MIIPEQHQLLLFWQWCNLNTGPTVLGNQNVSAGEYNFQNVCLVAQLGEQLLEKQILKIILDKL